MSDTTVRTRLWSTECKLADPSPEVKIDYVFGNGRILNTAANKPPVQENLNAPVNE